MNKQKRYRLTFISCNTTYGPYTTILEACMIGRRLMVTGKPEFQSFTVMHGTKLIAEADAQIDGGEVKYY